MDSKQLPPVLAHVTAAADALSACPVVKDAIAAILRDEKLTLADQIGITEVEAPPFHEEVRAKELVRRFEALGLTGVFIDPEGNVIARRAGTGNGPTLVLGAHLDTVFPEGTDVKVREENGIYHAPGISDDARGLAVILQVLRTLQEQKIETVGDICFVCTVGEEGNGDLRGSKYLFHKSGMAIDGFISVDGVDRGACCVPPRAPSATACTLTARAATPGRTSATPRPFTPWAGPSPRSPTCAPAKIPARPLPAARSPAARPSTRLPRTARWNLICAAPAARSSTKSKRRSCR